MIEGGAHEGRLWLTAFITFLYNVEKRLRKRFDLFGIRIFAKKIMPTMRDVARVASVSTSTVSHVINDTRYVSPETRARVLQAIKDLNYHHNRLASSLRHRRTRTLGLLLPNSSNPYFASILAGIEEACFENDYNIILGYAADAPERELTYLRVLLSRQVDGMLLVSTGAYEQSVALLNSYDVPVVMVDRSRQMDQVDEISADNYQGGRLATEHLLEYGHRRIACIAGPELSPAQERLRGYRDALHDAGITPDARLIVAGDFRHESGYDAMKQLLRLDAPPDAVFVVNDMMAMGALHALHRAGYRVPEDVSVVGYDDISLAAYTVPALTTIRQPAREVGQLAVTRLIERLNDPDLPARTETLPVTLVERGSSTEYTGG